MLPFHIGRYTYIITDPQISSYHRYRQLYRFEQSHTDNGVKSYDHMLHQSLGKIFRERCLSDSDRFKELIRSLQLKSILEPTLDQEPFLSEHFSKEEMGKLSLLWISVLCCYEKSAELLVRSGADVNELFGRRDPQVIDEKWTVLHVLLQMDRSPENERLIRLVADHGAYLQARDRMGRTVLHHAVMRARVQMTEVLLQKGADVNATDNYGAPPLVVAAMGDKPNKLVPLLIKHGADIFTDSRKGLSIMKRLAMNHSEHVDLVRDLIEMGVPLDDESDSGYTQLMYLSACSGHNELVKLFLGYGADVNAQNVTGQSPLHAAVRFGHRRVAETLLKRGANVDLKTFGGRTALHHLCESAVPTTRMFKDDIKLEAIIRVLLSAGADVLVEDHDGKTPLALISSGENAEPPGIRLLIKALALKKVRQPLIELKDERIIEQRPALLNYYRQCFEEIEKMKVTRFIGICTFFQLLAKSYCQIAKLMRNPDFETKFDSSEFAIYAEDIKLTFERARIHYKAVLEQENVINEAVYNTLPDLVVDKVVHYVFNCC